MTIDSMIMFATAMLVLAIKPGPGMMMLMSRSISQGILGLLSTLCGILLIILGYLILVFISFNIPGLDLVFITILMKSLAAVYLIYMGVKGLKNVHLTYNVQDIEGHSFYDNFSSAVVLTISNPIVIVFYAGILPTLVEINTMTINDMIIIASIVLTIEGVVPIIYCAPMIFYRKKIPIEFLKGLRIFSSIIIIFIGFYIGYSAIPAMDILRVEG